MMLNKCMVGIHSIAVSYGKKIVTNDGLKNKNPEWDMSRITERTGVFSRPHVGVGETALDLGLEAAEKLFIDSEVDVQEVDGIIFCTQTPDYLLPPNSALLHSKLKLHTKVIAFDITHACSGFMYSIGIARSLILSKSATNVLVVVADTYSKLTHPNDRSTRPLFGDAAAATLITSKNIKFKMEDIIFGTSGNHSNYFMVENGGARNPSGFQEAPTILHRNGSIHNKDYISMNGMGLLSFFNHIIPKEIITLLEKNNKSLDDVDLFIFHQASLVALEGIKKILRIPDEKLLINIQNTGNLVSASIPVLLNHVLESRISKRGDLILMCGFGVGLSWSLSLAYVENSY